MGPRTALVARATREARLGDCRRERPPPSARWRSPSAHRQGRGGLSRAAPGLGRYVLERQHLGQAHAVSVTHDDRLAAGNAAIVDVNVERLSGRLVELENRSGPDAKK